MSTTVILDSRVPEIVDHLEARAEALVEKTTFDVEAAAKENVIANGSVDTGALLNSIAGVAVGYIGEISVGVGYGTYVELGTGRRGAASEFVGKPAGIRYSTTGRWESRTYSIDSVERGATFSEEVFNEDWKGADAYPFLIPAIESARATFELVLGKLFA